MFFKTVYILYFVYILYSVLFLDFPAITICNLNPIRLSAFSSSDLFNAGQMYGILTEKMELKEDLFIGKGPKTDSLRKKTNFSDDDKNKPFNLEEFQMRAGHKIDEMLKACKWRDYTCTAADFSPVSSLIPFYFIISVILVN